MELVAQEKENILNTINQRARAVEDLKATLERFITLFDAALKEDNPENIHYAYCAVGAIEQIADGLCYDCSSTMGYHSGKFPDIAENQQKVLPVLKEADALYNKASNFVSDNYDIYRKNNKGMRPYVVERKEIMKNIFDIIESDYHVNVYSRRIPG